MFYGFTEFCKYFLEKFPGGYYIWPLRLNGSALEAIFSQLKFNMNGQLSSVNYPAALTTLKLKRRIHGWRGKFVYRRTPLYVRQISLKRKSRVKWVTVVLLQDCKKKYVVIFRVFHCIWLSWQSRLVLELVHHLNLSLQTLIINIIDNITKAITLTECVIFMIG